PVAPPSRGPRWSPWGDGGDRMLNSTQALLDPLEQWVKALRQDDFDQAKRYAETLIHDGELLASHPDFQRCFREHCGEVDTQLARAYLCRFLACAAEGRAHAVKQSQDRPGGPTPSEIPPAP